MSCVNVTKNDRRNAPKRRMWHDLLPIPRLSLFYKLLLLLAGFDCVFLFFGGLFMIQGVFNFSFSLYWLVFPKVIYPAAAIGMTGKTIQNQN